MLFRSDRALILRNGALVLDERLADLQKASALTLRTNASIPVASLVPGAAPLGEGRWRLANGEDLDAAAQQAAQALIGADAPIYELRPEVKDLETLFREVSEGAAP